MPRESPDGRTAPVVLGQISSHLPYSNSSAWLHEVTFWSPYNDAMSLNFPLALLLWQGYYMNSCRQCHSCNLCDCLHYNAIARWITGFCWMNALIADLSLFVGNLHVFESIKQSLCPKGDNSLSHVNHTFGLISNKTHYLTSGKLIVILKGPKKNLTRNKTWGSASSHSAFDKGPCECYMLNNVSIHI